MKYIFSILAAGLFTCMFSQTARATTFGAGDLAIIGYNYDDADELKFVTLVDVASGTTIYITDNAWTGSALGTTEGTYTYTFSSAVSKGTVIGINPTSVSFSTSGDQIIIYQGSAGSPTFVTALSSTAWLTSGSTTSNTSYLPSGLTNGTNCIAFTSEKDDGNYSTVSNSGDKATLSTAINTQANWSLTDTRITSWPSWSFTVTGGLASEPTASATAFTSSNVKSYKYDVSWTAASPAPAGYLVLWKKGSAPGGSPADATTYQPGDAIGDAKVGAVGNLTSLTQKGIIEASTGYYYKIFSYNGSGATINYLTSSSLSGSLTTSGNMMGTYYSGCNTASSSFLDSLQARIRRNYTKITYTNYTSTMMADFAYVDTSAGQRAANCMYSDTKYLYTTFAWYTTGTFSREHTWCHSWMPTYSSTSGNEYSDQHHLFPVEQIHANGVRSNHPLGVVSSVISTFGNSVYGNNTNGNHVFQPQASHRGNSARALLYMAVRYNGVSGYDWSFNYLNGTTLPALAEDSESLQTLLAWHTADPVDNYEIARNDYVYSLQGNRNPFVDHPEYVDYINFYNVTYNTNGSHKWEDDETLGENAVSQDKFRLYVMPNPFENNMMISMNSNQAMNTRLSIYDITGKLVVGEAVTITKGFNVFEFDTHELPAGIYTVKVEGNGRVSKIVKE